MRDRADFTPSIGGDHIPSQEYLIEHIASHLNLSFEEIWDIAAKIRQICVDNGSLTDFHIEDKDGNFISLKIDAQRIITSVYSPEHRSEVGADSVSEDEMPVPPPWGERLVSILSGHMKEAVLGDLAENFERRVERDGARKARAWYRWQAARSIGHFSVRWLRRLMELDAFLQRIGF